MRLELVFHQVNGDEEIDYSIQKAFHSLVPRCRIIMCQTVHAHKGATDVRRKSPTVLHARERTAHLTERRVSL